MNKKSGGIKRIALVALAAILIAQLAIHFSLLDSIYFLDETVYATVGWLWTHGQVPYADVFEHKPPGIFFLAFALFKLFSPSMLWPRVLIAFVQVGCTVLVFETTRKAYDWRTAALASIFFVAFEIFSNGQWFTIEPFLTFFSLVFIYALAPAFTQKGKANFALAGLAVGFASIFKQQGLFLWPIGIAAFAYLWSKKEAKSAGLAQFVLVGLIPIIATIGYFALIGHLAEFAYANGAYNFTKSASTVEQINLEYYLLPLFAVLGMVPPALVFEYKYGRKRWSILLLAMLAWSATLLVPRFHVFHFQAISAFAAILTGTVIIKMFEYSEKLGILLRITTLYIVITLLVCAATSYIESTRDNTDVARINEIGSMISQTTTPSEKIYVFPLSIEFYFFSQREPVSKYIWVAPWTTPQQQAEVLNDLRQVKPRMIVYDTVCETEYCRDGKPSAFAPEISQYLLQNYRLVKTYTLGRKAYIINVMERK